jgi:hypothetical protein
MHLEGVDAVKAGSAGGQLSARWVHSLAAPERSPSIILASKAEGGLTDGG